MSKKAGFIYAALLFTAAIFIHLIVSGKLNVRYEISYSFIGLLLGAGILLILQGILKKI
ncbi:MAG: hypothetical protein KA807_04580 [Prolixibacteraceae bacterium]|nr:hypothetical protein [Prolixibacteraceae bacterium]